MPRTAAFFFSFWFIAAAQDAEHLYQKHCATCHEGEVARAPLRSTFVQMSPEAIEMSLTRGNMRIQGRALTLPQIGLLSRHLSGVATAKAVTTDSQCHDTPPFEHPLEGPHWNGWGAGLWQHRSQTAAMAMLSAADVPRLKLKWAFGFPAVTRAPGQPTVAGGRVFVGSLNGTVYSLDAKTGCTYWAYDAGAAVRTAISIGAVGPAWAAFFGDQRGAAYAVNAATGALLWKTRVEDHPDALVTGAPTLAEGRLYVPVSSGEEVTAAGPEHECCKFRGSVTALDAATGRVIWKSFTIAETPRPTRKSAAGTQLWGPSGAGVWSSPTVDLAQRRLYVTTGDSYSEPAAQTSDAFLAFNLDDGKLLWSRQMTAGDAYNVAEPKGPDFDFGSSPILVNLPNGKRALVAGQKSGLVHAIDPDQQGEVLWQRRVGKGGTMGGVQWGSAVDSRNVYVAVSDVGIRPASADKPGAQKSPFGRMFELDPTQGGGLFALDLATGELAWTTPHPGCNGKPGCSPAQSAAVTLIPGVVFSGGLDGRLRAYRTSDGKIVWDVGTSREYSTVNGVKANGGALDGPGPVAVAGMLFVESGYAFLGGAPGNVLLAFSVDGK